MLVVPINSSAVLLYFDRLNGLLSALCWICCHGVMLGDYIVICGLQPISLILVHDMYSRYERFECNVHVM